MSDAALTGVVAGLGAAVLERRRDASFRLLGDPPKWLERIGAPILVDPDRVEPGRLSPFLENFLIDAGELWARGKPGRLYSGVWTEELPGGSGLPLEAIAVRLDDERELLLIGTVHSKYIERLGLLQRARSASLEHERLRSETQQKEVLLHCIVHDLKQPLAGMMGSLSLLQSPTLSEERRREMLEMGLQQARRQQQMIHQVLDVFSAEVESMESFERTRGAAPDLARAVDDVTRGMESAFLERGVELEVDLDREQTLEVVGRRDRLERVFANLLENALRYAPAGTAVTVGARREGDRVDAWVADRGPGVAPELVATLFDKLVGGGSARGSMGLGLYFCRYTVETWGGSIAYEPSPTGGALFRLRLAVPGA